MQDSSSIGSHEMVAIEALQASDIHFPFTLLSDFIIHYRGTAFHVHKFILCYQSVYFRAYIEQLTQGQRAYPANECSDHPNTAYCIRLPGSCGKVEASAADFQRFLCHLYFQQHYSCIPYFVRTDVDLTAQPPPAVTLDYPKFNSWADLHLSMRSTALDVDEDEAVMSLCHYFECALALSRAEDNCSLMVAAAGSLWKPFADRPQPRAGPVPIPAHIMTGWRWLWACLLLASKFNLRRVADECVPLLAQYCRYMHKFPDHHRQQWASMQQLDKSTLIELLQAVCGLSR